MFDKINDLMEDERGATMVEYSLMLAFVAAVCVTILTSLGPRVSATFVPVDTALP